MGTVKYSGPVASFHCPTEATIRSLKVHFSPKQEGSGDPSPLNVRAISGWTGVEVYRSGKNLVNISNDNIIYQNFSKMTDGSYYQISGNIVTLYNQNAKSLMVCFAVMPITSQMVGISFTLNANATGDGDYGIFLSDLDGSNRTSNKANPYTIASGDVGKLIGARVRMNGVSGTYTVSNIQFELGSAVTDYEPYQRSTYPITFPILGKNKFDKDNAVILNGYPNSTTIDSSPYSKCICVQVLPNTTYTVSKMQSARFAIALCSETTPFVGSTISGLVANHTYTGMTKITNSDTKWLIVWLYASNYDTDSLETILASVQVELGNTATTYEPYNPNNTVYGGWVDLITGEVVSTYAHCKIKDLPGEWNYRSSNLRFQIQLTENYMKNNSGWTNCAISEKYKTSTSQGYGNKQIATYINRHIYIRDDDFEGNLEAFLTGVGDSYISYELATPTYYSLAPTQLQTFLGQNNVWSNADYVEVEYDLHETQTLLQRKAFIMANQPHIASASGAIASFNTDLLAPLKSAKFEFLPVQEGSGDPSPTNVRPISGWTGCEVYRGYEYLSNVQITIGKTLNASGLETTEGGMAVTDYIPVEVGHTYTLKFTSTTAGRTRRIFGYSASKEPTSQLASVSWATVGNTFSMNAEIPSDTSYIRACYYNNDIDKTLIEPSTVTTFPIDWTTEAGTIYGGYVDLVSGEVVAEWYKVVADGVNVKANSSYMTDNYIAAGIVYLNPNGMSSTTAKYANNVLCNIMPVYSQYYLNNHRDEVSYPYASATQAGQQYIVFHLANRADYPEVTDATSCKNFVNAWLQEHPATLVYELRTPITYQIDPTILKTLHGTNNIWSNANDNTTVQYYKH